MQHMTKQTQCSHCHMLHVSQTAETMEVVVWLSLLHSYDRTKTCCVSDPDLTQYVADHALQLLQIPLNFRSFATLLQ